MDGGAWLGDDFGQKVDLTARIREILRNYPEGTSIFKELIQNADDAGAQEVRLVIDARTHGTAKLPPHPPLSQLQGPALLCYNNARFTEVDFQSIQRIGDSLKKEDSQGTKTGRFGVGFNSVYHLTEVPSFVSGKYIVMFDPQAAYLPNVNPANPGKMIDYAKHTQLLTAYPDQFTPLQAFDCNLFGGSPYDGTLFRFPLRTAAQAETSRLSKQAHTPESIRAQLSCFMEEAPSMLLFLKHVQRLSVFEWHNNSTEPAPRCLYEVGIANMSPELRNKRNFVAAIMAQNGGKVPSQSFRSEYFLDIAYGNPQVPASKRQETWAVCTVVGGGRATAMAQAEEHKHMKLIPWAGVAGRIALTAHAEGDKASPPPPAPAGLAYCFLPLPVLSGLPVHVNGYFELSSNRRDIWYGDDMIGDGRNRAEWNRALLCDLIAPCYVRLLSLVSPRTGPGPVYDSLWPLTATGPAWQELLDAFYAEAKATPLLYSMLHSGTWVRPDAAVLIPSQGRGLCEPQDADADTATGLDVSGGSVTMPLPSTLGGVLLEEGLPLVRASHPLEDVLISRKVVGRVATPAFLRDHFRLPSSSPPSLDPASLHPSLSTLRHVHLLLRYCLQDLSDNSAPSLLASSLHLLPLLPTASGAVRPILVYTHAQAPGMEKLVNMGFSLGAGLRALAMHPPDAKGDVERTVTWLLEQQAAAEKNGEAFELGDLVLASCEAEELRLFGTVASHLLNIQQVHATPRALLMSNRVQQMSNVRALSTAHLPAILRYLLPPAWRKEHVVTWHEDSVPTLDWFRALWHYLSTRMTEDLTMSPLEELLPLLPCHEGVVCRLSKRQPLMLLGDTLTPHLLAALRQVGLLTLHEAVVKEVGDVGLAGLKPYLHSPTRKGLLSCLSILYKRQTPFGTSPDPAAFSARLSESLSVEACGELRALLEREPMRELTPTQVDMVKLLPIFRVAHPAQAQAQASQAQPPAPALAPRLTSLLPSPLYLLEVSLEAWGAYEPLLSPQYLHPETQAQAELFRLLGAKPLTKVEFFMFHLFPRFSELDGEVRSCAMRDLVLPDLPNLVQADHKFAAMIRDLCFLPNATGQVSRCHTMYDPEVEELAQLVGEEHFPHPAYSTPELLPVLRQLGLRSTLQFEDVVVIACSVRRAAEADLGTGVQRARNLFHFLNANADRFFSPLPMGPEARGGGRAHPKSFFDRAIALFDEQGKAAERNRVAKLEEQERQRQSMVAQLRSIPWIPTLVTPPQPYLPWRRRDEADPTSLALCVPTACRLGRDMWLSSALYGMVDADYVADRVEAVFGWNTPLAPEVLARQLVSIAEAFHAFSDAHPLVVGPVGTQLEGEVEAPDAKSGDGAAKTHPEVQQMQQKVTAVVPVLYNKLSSVIQSAQEPIRRAMGGKPWVFVGDRFVHAEQVAFVSQVNATPYLYNVPADLACFAPLLKAFGVRDSFGCSDFVQVLKGMAVETKVVQPSVAGSGSGPPAKRAPPPPPVPLSLPQLDLAIALVQRVSDDLMQVSNWEVFAPDESRVLVRSTELVYDDAPWLSKGQNRKDIRFVHPKISALVGEKLGIMSLRRLLMESHTDSLDFGLPSEAFGQSEEITRRLHNILKLYPEGPSILGELIQNADDAGASVVRIMYNARSYGTSSLLGQKMGVWQGPALYFYNDAMFSHEDFQNIARIGQASKLEKVVSTGRFGLGFNATYHCTDLPSFVSNESLVMFDPHTKYLPGAEKHAPGLKIRFVDTDLISQFPDQFEPYSFFGCNLQERFDGTLFRFPLRTEDLKRESQISNSKYDGDTIKELFSSFQESIERFLLFLRKVDRIEVYVHGAGPAGSSAEPTTQLLYRASRSMTDKKKWDEVSLFMSGPPHRPLSKEAFYAKLASTPQAQLPRVSQMFDVHYEDGIIGWDGAPLERRRVRRDWFQVVAGLGGGSALKMAVDAQHRHLKFIPFGGVAAHIFTQDLANGQEGERVAVTQTAKRGQVFCFLPLPVDSGLPVFINGYFELSSNRRDIWSGGDMTGEGKQRSDWNQALLKDVVTPLYADLMESLVRNLPMPTSLAQYYTFFPSPKNTQKQFANVSILFYGHAHSRRLLYSDAQRGSWVPPSDSLLIDQDGSSPMRSSDVTSRLRDILVNRGMCVVAVPRDLQSILVEQKCCLDEASPPFVRRLVRRPYPNWPANQDDAQFLLVYCIEDLKGDDLLELEGLPLIPLADGTLGRFAITNTDGTPTASHYDDPLQLYFLVEESEKQLFASAQDILVRPPGSLLPRVSEFLQSSLVLSKTNVARFGPRNLESFLSYVLPPTFRQSPQVKWEPGQVVQANGRAAPEHKWVMQLWVYLSSAAFASNSIAKSNPAKATTVAASGSSQTNGGPAQDAVPAVSLADVSRACGEWPILPAVVGKRRLQVLLRVDSGMPCIYMPRSIFSMNLDQEGLQSALVNLTIRVIDLRMLPPSAEAVYLCDASKALVAPLGTRSILDAINNIAGPDADLLEVFKTEVSAEERRALRSYLADPQVLQEARSAFTDRHVLRQALARLPIYESYKGHTLAMGDDRLRNFCTLSAGPTVHYLPPDTDGNAILLDNGTQTFLQFHNMNDRSLLEEVGLQPMPWHLFYRQHFVPRLGSLPAKIRNKTTQTMLENLGDIKAEDPSIVHFLRSCAILPASSGHGSSTTGSGEATAVLRRVCDLYDSEVPILRSLLNEDAFPSHEFCSGHLLTKLRELGLQTRLTLDGVIMSAKSIDELWHHSDKRMDALRRGAELYAFLHDNLDGLVRAAANGQGLPTPPSTLPPAVPPAFAAELCRLSWLPVRGLHSLLMPEPPGPIPRVSTPLQCRPQPDAWLCSSQLFIAEVDRPQSSLLLETLTWDRPIPPDLLTRQVLRISEKYAQDPSPNFKEVLKTEVPKIYVELQKLVLHPQTQVLLEEWDCVLKLLDRKAWVWVEDTFCDLNRVAFQAPPNSKPYLRPVPESLTPVFPLLRALHVRETFHARDFTKALELLREEGKGQPLKPDERNQAVAMLNALTKCPAAELQALLQAPSSQMVLYAPDKNGVMYRTSDLCYNDADWLMQHVQNRASLRFVHDQINAEVAKKIGARSLREALLKTECSEASQPCPSPQTLFTSLSPYIQSALRRHSKKEKPEEEAAGDLVVQALLDVMEVAEFMHSPAVEVVVDERQHRTESLLHPCLADGQGPALIMYLPGVLLTPSDIISFMSPNRELVTRPYPPPPQGSLDERESSRGDKGDKDKDPSWPPQGRGFASLFHLTDCLQVLTGDQFHLFDPTGHYLLGDPSAAGTEPTQAAQDSTTNGAEAEASQGESTTPQFFADSDPKSGDPVSRRYRLEGNLHTRFPDQFHPFMTLLPLLLANTHKDMLGRQRSLSSSGGGGAAVGPFPVAGTIIRAPFRKKTSALSPLCPTGESLYNRLTALAQSAIPSLVFSTVMQRIRVGKVPKPKSHAPSGEGEEEKKGKHAEDEEDVRLDVLLSTSLTGAEAARLRDERRQFLENKEWKRKGLINAILRPKTLHNISTFQVTRETRNGGVCETWVLVDVVCAKIRDAALSEPFKSMGMTPVVSVATRLKTGSLETGARGDEARWIVDPGKVFCIQDTLAETGLPFHVNAPFIVIEALLPQFDAYREKDAITLSSGAFSGIQGPAKLQLERLTLWNRELVEAMFLEGLPVLLDHVKEVTLATQGKVMTQGKETTEATEFYNYWPYLCNMPPRWRALAHRANLMQRLGSGAYFLAPMVQQTTPQQGRAMPRKPEFVKTGEAIFVAQSTGIALRDFLNGVFTLFEVPYKVAQELKDAGVDVKEITPKKLRSTLRKFGLSIEECQTVPGLALELLTFCLGDTPVTVARARLPDCVKAWKEMSQLPVIALEGGFVGRVAEPNRVYILAAFMQRALLPHINDRFVARELIAHPCVSGLLELPQFRECMGLVPFTPEIIAQYISAILPREWKDCTRISVSFDQVAPPFSALWLYRFWQLVPLRVASELFAEWPLVPTTSGDLISCRLAAQVLRLTQDQCNQDLQAQLEQESREAEEQEAKRVAAAATSSRSDSSAPRPIGDFSDGERDPTAEDLRDELLPRSVCLNVAELFEVDKLRQRQPPTPQQQQQRQAAVVATSSGAPPPGATGEAQAAAQSASTEQQAAIVASPRPSSAAAATPTPALSLPSAPPTTTRQGPTSPTAGAPPSAPANAPQMTPSEREKRKALMQLLNPIQLPVLELAFFPRDVQGELVGLDARTAVGSVITGLVTFRETLVWDRIAGDAQDKLLCLLSTAPQGDRVALNQSEIAKVKMLPVFETLAGERVSISDGTFAMMEETGARDRFLDELQRILVSSDLTRRANILKRKAELTDLYTDLGVQTLKKTQVLEKALVPELQSMSRENRQQVLHFIRSRWMAAEDRISEDADFKKALSEAKFVEKANGELVCAKELLDPRNEVLRELFDDDPDAFPPGEFAKPEWLEVLSALGLKNEVDVECMKLCGLRLERLSTLTPLPFAVAQKASLLVQQVVAHASNQPNKNFLKAFATLKCVPVEKPGLHVTGRGDSGLTPNRQYMLVSYAQTCAAKEAALIWTVLPVLLRIHEPSQLSWSSLSIISPPPREAVVTHLVNLTTGGAQGHTSIGEVKEEQQQAWSLDTWVYTMPPVSVFQAIYRFLDDEWAKIPPRIKVQLKDLPCVPVANRLVKASRLYFRLTVDLSPFMFEVPRAFGAYDKLFKELGTKQSPGIRDYAQLLSELKGECGAHSLNPNELEAVIKVIVLLADTVASQRNDDQSVPLSVREHLQAWELYVPDDRSVLVPMDTCLYDDASWLRGRVHAHLLRVVHPRITVQTCEAYGIRRISQVVREALEKDFVPEVVPSHDGGQLVDTFTSEEAARALASLLMQRNLRIKGEKEQPTQQQQPQGQGSLTEAAGDGHESANLEEKTRVVQERLTGFRVQHVKTLRSRFLRRRHPVKGQEQAAEEEDDGEEEDITSQPEGSMFFVDGLRKEVLLASPLLPPSVTPAYVLALAVTQMLAIGPEGDSLVAPLSAVLATPKGGIPSVMALLRLDRRDEAKAQHLRRSVPGQALLPMDRPRVELRPMRAHLKNEIIAWQDANKVLRYGVVVSPAHGSEDDEGTDGGSEEKKGGEGGGGAHRPKEATPIVRRLLVRVAPGKVQEMSSTQIYCFRATRSGGSEEESEGDGIATPRPSEAPSSSSSTPAPQPSAVRPQDARLRDLIMGEGESGEAPAPVQAVQVLDAVDDMLSRVNLSLSTDKREVLERYIRMETNLGDVVQQLDKSKNECAAMADEMKRVRDALLCQVCTTLPMDRILPCGHMLCLGCSENVSLRCPWCRVAFRTTKHFNNPFAGSDS